jgi:N-succinyldiaminopimelate aminotransferase
MTQLALKHNAINLSQGFPDFDGPQAVKDSATAAIQNGHNQYAHSIGQVELRRAIAAHAARFYGQDINPDTEVTVATGASETLLATTLGLINPGDEVIVFEPFFDIYIPDIEFAGGVVRYVPLRPNPAGHSEPGEAHFPAQSKEADSVDLVTWYFDPDELAAAFNDRTRAILVNTPHNPTGKVFTRAELQFIADLCLKWNVVAITDEVYEHIVFTGAQHIRLATLPGMAERTVTISSHGKTFSFTGWKIGWAIAPPDLTVGIRRAHQSITFASSTPFQHAAAFALTLEDEYFQALAADYESKRNYLADVLRETGFGLTRPDGTYFIMAGINKLGFDDDVAFCRHLIADVGIAAIPPTAFYCDDHKSIGRAYVRFAFCKKMATLEQAAERLRRLR